MFDLSVVALLVIAFVMLLAGISISLLHHLFRQHRFLIRQSPARLGPIQQGTFTLIYFTTPASILCKKVQGPAIEKLRNVLGNDLQIFIIDITEQPELARLWGVWNVPTTFLINHRGELSHVNQGVAHAEKLLMQMHGLETGS
jgi:hypothetical protein